MFNEENFTLSESINLLFSDENIATTLSIAVSTLVALFVLGVNQWYSNRHERKKIICEKIEEFYEASIAYTNACDQLVTDIQLMKFKRESGYYSNDPIAYSRFEQSLSKMEMLHGLYFPKVEFDSNDFCIKNMPIIWAANSGEIARRTVNIDEVYNQSRAHIENSSELLGRVCKELMRKNML